VLPLQFWGINLLNKRILAIKRALFDSQSLSRQAPQELEEQRRHSDDAELRLELDELQSKRQFLHENRTLVATLIAPSIAALGIFASVVTALIVPIWQQERVQEAEIQGLYRNIIANTDIFIGNYGMVKNAINGRFPLSHPEPHKEFVVSDRTHELLQRKLGIDQYRLLLYFMHRTALLNEEISNVEEEIAAKGLDRPAGLESLQRYWLSLSALDSGTWENAKLNYIYDPGCLEYLLFRTFRSIRVVDRDKTATCNSDSLHRIFWQYGFIPAETPAWLIPELRAALNEHESGLGDRAIQPWAHLGFTDR
jgi:hypothetical protein